MSTYKPPSIYPTRGNLNQVIQEGIAQLPITTPNALIALLNTYSNTAQNIKQTKQEISPIHLHSESYRNMKENIE